MDLTELFRREKNLVTVAAGQTVFRAGDHPGGIMYVLMHGSADVLVGDTVVENAAPGALLGEMGLIDPAERSATVVARSECRFVAIDVERFNALIQHTPGFAIHVLKIIVERLRRMDFKLLETQQTANKKR